MNHKKRIAIITLYHKNDNYGAMLQAYALKEAISSIDNGFSVDILQISHHKPSIGKRISTNTMLFGMTGMMVRAIKKLISILTYPLLPHELLNVRAKTFCEFRNKLSSNTEIYDIDSINDTLEIYDIFITGSDQVWNQLHINGVEKIYWLEFVPSEKIKISYAASMGVHKITKNQATKIQNYLKDYRLISVRESQLKTLLDNTLRGQKSVQWVLDPTLLLTLPEWDRFCNPRIIQEKYIFVYYLLDGGSTSIKRINEFAKKNGYKIVTIPYSANKFRSYDLWFGDYRLYNISPQDFLSLLKYAEYICTNSFHCTALSGVYNKEFFTFISDTKVYGKNYRIESLLSMYGVEDRVVNCRNFIESTEKVQPLNFDKINNKICEARASSYEKLKDALSN